MSVEIQMPQMGESVTEGTVLEWHVAEGDAVEEGDTVVEVSTDKVDAEVPAPTSGTVTSIRAQPDEEVKVGAVLATIAPGETDADQGGHHPAAPAAEQSSADRSPDGSLEAEEAAGIDSGSAD